MYVNAISEKRLTTKKRQFDSVHKCEYTTCKMNVYIKYSLLKHIGDY